MEFFYTLKNISNPSKFLFVIWLYSFHKACNNLIYQDEQAKSRSPTPFNKPVQYTPAFLINDRVAGRRKCTEATYNFLNIIKEGFSGWEGARLFIHAVMHQSFGPMPFHWSSQRWRRGTSAGRSHSLAGTMSPRPPDKLSQRGVPRTRLN